MSPLCKHCGVDCEPIGTTTNGFDLYACPECGLVYVILPPYNSNKKG